MIDIDLIRVDGGTQSRVEPNLETVAEYVEAYKAGAVFPPVKIFFDGSNRWLADGFHRLLAAKAAGRTSILENIELGTLRDAILYSVKANATHGLKRTNSDKRQAVSMLLADPEWSTWSNESIAKACGVSPHTVADVKKSISAFAEIETVRKVERNGKIYEQNTAKIGKLVAPLAQAALDDEQEDHEYGDCGPSKEEINASIKAEADQFEHFKKLLESDDPLAQALFDIKRYKEAARIANERFDGMMNEKAELIRLVKSLKNKLAKAGIK